MNNLLMQEALNIKVDFDFEKAKLALSNNNYAILSLPLSSHIPLTPTEGDFNVFEIKEIAVMLLSIHNSLGLFPVVYEGENDGRLIRNVCPVKKSTSQIGSQGSMYDFDTFIKL